MVLWLRMRSSPVQARRSMEGGRLSLEVDPPLSVARLGPGRTAFRRKNQVRRGAFGGSGFVLLENRFIDHLPFNE